MHAYNNARLARALYSREKCMHSRDRCLHQHDGQDTFPFVYCRAAFSAPLRPKVLEAADSLDFGS